MRDVKQKDQKIRKYEDGREQAIGALQRLRPTSSRPLSFPDLSDLSVNPP
jgi:hypothetical protein